MAICTARVAVRKGRNPWVWGGAALVLGILPPPFHPLLGVVPVLFLIFLRAPDSGTLARPRPASCPKCAQPHPPGQNFCTGCGWDLSHDYTSDSGDTVLASDVHAPQTSTATTEPPPVEQAPPDPRPSLVPEPPSGQESSEDPAPAAEPEIAVAEPVAAGGSAAEPPSAAPPSAESPEGEAETVTEEPDAPEPVAPEPAPAQPVRPWGVPEPSTIPTAALMTARGVNLLSEGRVQEAIDQFTKAIALDPDYREAWERRAESYTQQGRRELADADYRRVQALNA